MKGSKGRDEMPILLGSLIMLAAIFVYLFWGNVSIQVTKIEIEDADIPAGFQGCTICQLSDFHNAHFGDGQKHILEKLRLLEPDFIFITGDLIDSRHTDISAAMELIDGAVAIAPIYYVTGNHESRIAEYKELEQAMIKSGVIILKDETVKIKRNGDTVHLIGLNDPSFSDASGSLSQRLSTLSTQTDGYTILLSHRPEFFETYCSSGIDLVFCGHAHGGQVRLPFVGGLYAPNQGLFPKYTSGRYRSGNTEMIVSRGIGNSLAPVRINNRPEIVAVVLNGIDDKEN